MHRSFRSLVSQICRSCFYHYALSPGCPTSDLGNAKTHAMVTTMQAGLLQWTDYKYYSTVAAFFSISSIGFQMILELHFKIEFCRTHETFSWGQPAHVSVQIDRLCVRQRACLPTDKQGVRVTDSLWAVLTDCKEKSTRNLVKANLDRHGKLRYQIREMTI